MIKATTLRAKLGVHALNFALLSGTMLSSPALAQEALPTGGQVVAGSATIETSGSTMTINQSSDRMIANWQTFNIGAVNTVTFNQPTAQSVALNRVIGQDPSQILGRLTANGQVFLINPNGIVIGKGGSVQSGGFVGSTLDIANADFLSGNYRFTGTGGAIVNQGELKGGVVALIAPRVSNEGTITGNTALAGGTDVTLDFTGDGLVSVEVDASTLATLVENKGLIQADGGVAILTARGASDAMRGVVNNTGTIEAGSLENRDGRILLLGDMDHGEVQAGGTLQAGFVETSARSVNIADDIQVKTGGGQWLIDPNDFTIAASGGNISGATLSNNLANGNVTISTASQGTPGGSGDIHVNDTVTWSANTLTLRADRNISINTTMNGSGTAGLALEYGQTEATGDYYVNAPVNLASTGSFSTKKGSDPTRNYTIITSLGAQGSTTGTDLQGMNANYNNYYVLGANIDASPTANWNSGAGFLPLVFDAPSNSGFIYGGAFNGLGHVVDGLYINRPGLVGVGLFGSLPPYEIRNLGLTNVRITGGDGTGGLIGQMGGGIVRFSYTTGSVEGDRYVGGLVGGAGISGPQIIQSYSTSTVTGSEHIVGGLVGSIGDGAVIDSYATGNVTGTNWVGGLIGSVNTSRIANSYATGTVVASSGFAGGLIGRLDVRSDIPNNYHIAVNNFFDSQTSGQGSACGEVTATAICGATGLTTAQMKDPATFTAAGWDFTNIWAIDPAINNGYPYLRATVAAAPPPPPPPPPPPTALTVSDITNFSTSSAPYQPTIALTGTGFSDVTEVRFTWTDPNGQTGTVTWNAANNFGGGRFVVGAGGTSATIAPTLIASGDPNGTYQWSVTFVAGTQTVTKSFAVAYSGVVTPPPPPPPPPVVTLSLTSNISDLTYASATPWRLQIPISGQGLNGVTSITLNWVDPAGRTGSATWNAANNFGGGSYAPSASGTSATLTPTLLAAGDPPGLYQWTVTLTNGTQTVTDRFNVTYTATTQGTPVVFGPVQPSTSPVLGGGTVPPLYVTTAPYLTGDIAELLSAVAASDIRPSMQALIRETISAYGSIEDFDLISQNVPYATLANAAYDDNPSVPGWTNLNGEFGSLTSNDEVGFNATVFRNTATGEVVIAYRGTDSGVDWRYTNLTGGAGQEPLARALYDAVVARYGAVTLTGHSLGGGLAESIAADTGAKAVAFDPAPFASGNSAQIGNYSNITSFRNASDPLTAITGGFNLVQPTTVQNAAGIPLTSIDNVKSNHSMANLLIAMQAVALVNAELKAQGIIR